jgi:bifunctional DNase/RNase
MLVEAEVWTIARTDQGNAVLVRPVGSDTAVPIFIGQQEAQSILIGMGNVPMPRPLTHDLFLSVMQNVGTTIERIEITELKEGTFYAQLIIKRQGQSIIIDARPSDSIALAVRDKCPIFIDEEIVEEAGIPVSTITEQVGDTQDGETGDIELENLQKELAKAVEEENYEEAARIRDLISDYQIREGD